MILSELIKKLVDFFFSFFSYGTEDFKNQKALRTLDSELKNTKYPVFRHENTVLAGLPIIIYELHHSLLICGYILKSTIASQDIRVASLFLDKIIEDNFNKEEIAIRESLTLKNRCENIHNFISTDFDTKLKAQTKTFYDLVFCLSDDKFKTIDSTIVKLYAFYDLYSFNFNGFFAHFDASFEAISGTNVIKEHYNFQNIDGKEVLQDILDLDYLINNVVIDGEFIKGIMFLNSKLHENVRQKEDDIKNSLRSFKKNIDNDLHPNTLKALAKLIKRNPFFEDNVKQKQIVKATDEYIERFKSIFNADTKKILKMQQEEQMSSLIEKVFSKTEILKIETYNEELNKRIQSVTNLSLDWVKPLELIKTYTKSFFEPMVEPFLRELIVEGFFDDKDFQSTISSNYYYCAGILTKLNQFEESMAGKNDHSLATIKGYLTRLESGGDFEKPLQKVIDSLNTKAGGIVKDVAQHYSDLFKECSMIVKDSHKSMPEYVNNLRAMISSTRNKEKFASFEGNINAFSNFIDILKLYVILDVPPELNAQRNLGRSN